MENGHGLSENSGSQSVVPGPAALASPENFLKIQILSPIPDFTE